MTLTSRTSQGGVESEYIFKEHNLIAIYTFSTFSFIQKPSGPKLALSFSWSGSTQGHYLYEFSRNNIPHATYQVSRQSAQLFWAWRPSWSCDLEPPYKLSFLLGRAHGAPYRGYGYVPLRFGENVVGRMGTQQQLPVGCI